MNDRLHRLLGRITEPLVLLPVFAVLLLGALWGSTLNLIGNELAGARRAAAVSTAELTDTYEAQMLRALREIDLTLKFVQFAHAGTEAPALLDELHRRGLLPPDLLFGVSIADARGEVVASSRPLQAASVAGMHHFDAHRGGEAGVVVSPPARDLVTGEWQFLFSRRLEDAAGAFAGIVIVAVDAAYFVAGYDASKLGRHGVLGVLASDGRFLVRRTGSEVQFDDPGVRIDLSGSSPDEAAESTVAASLWDQRRRYTATRELPDFALAIVVGLAEDEQLAAAEQRRRTHLVWSAAGSLLLIALLAVLARTSRQLARSRQRMIASQQAHVERVEYLAYHDGLTGLPNRSLFSRLLQQAITSSRRYRRRLAVMFLDLDHFKHINDTLGHAAGDELLQAVAGRLKSCLRENDCVARLGGDEFVVLLPEMVSEEAVATVARKILAAVAEPFDLRGQQFCVTASIGIGTYPEDGLDEQTLKKNADIAMYQAKSDGKNNFRFHSVTSGGDPGERRRGAAEAAETTRGGG